MTNGLKDAVMGSKSNNSVHENPVKIIHKIKEKNEKKQCLTMKWK